jgi:hypothetical protein
MRPRALAPLLLLATSGVLVTSALKAEQPTYCFLMTYVCHNVSYVESCPCSCTGAEDDACSDHGPIFGACTGCG